MQTQSLLPSQPPAVPDKLALGSGPLHPALNSNSPHNLILHPPGGILATSTPVDGLGMPFNDHSSMYSGGSGDVTLGVDGVTTIAGDVMHHEDEDDDDHHHHRDDDDGDHDDEDEDRGRTPTPTSAHPFPPASFAGGSYTAYQQKGHVGTFVGSPEKMRSREGSSRAVVDGGGGGANGINAHGIVGVDVRKGSLPAYSALDPYAAFPITSVPQTTPC